jgi:hypothetical protein
MHWRPVLKRTVEEGEVVALTLGHALVDDYLGFVGARARPNTLLATAFDLKVFFSVVEKDPAQVTRADVFIFLKSQRTSNEEAKIVRLEDGERGLSARTIARRLSSVSGLFAYLLARGDTPLKGNPVPEGLASRRPGRRRGHGGVPLIRTPHTLPRFLAPVEVDALMGALRTHRAEPECDNGRVDASLEQVHGARVAEDVRSQGLVRQRRLRSSCRRRVLAEEKLDRVRAEAATLKGWQTGRRCLLLVLPAMLIGRLPSVG